MRGSRRLTSSTNDQGLILWKRPRRTAGALAFARRVTAAPTPELPAFHAGSSGAFRGVRAPKRRRSRRFGGRPGMARGARHSRRCRRLAPTTPAAPQALVAHGRAAVPPVRAAASYARGRLRAAGAEPAKGAHKQERTARMRRAFPLSQKPPLGVQINATHTGKESGREHLSRFFREKLLQLTGVCGIIMKSNLRAAAADRQQAQPASAADLDNQMKQE